MITRLADDSARTVWRKLDEASRDDREYVERAAPLRQLLEARLDALSTAVSDTQASTVEAEEFRRLSRELAAVDRHVVEARARIDERTKAAHLAIEHLVDRANQQLYIYWYALRRHHRYRDALVDEPKPIPAPEWLPAAATSDGGHRTTDALPMKWTGEKRRAKN
ncbi:hypothetical protein [Naasia sp. SYSU D00057]|uniref:hypothetical protein n=1 Tax=Naasia sp. SYSU D00057 TaxID=2817380 RepID=UPI001B30CFE2|nr:hypothetical protein [Naasia sp. SYSU D00057]